MGCYKVIICKIPKSLPGRVDCTILSKLDEWKFCFLLLFLYFQIKPSFSLFHKSILVECMLSLFWFFSRMILKCKWLPFDSLFPSLFFFKKNCSFVVVQYECVGSHSWGASPLESPVLQSHLTSQDPLGYFQLNGFPGKNHLREKSKETKFHGHTSTCGTIVLCL